ncbi:MAG: Lacal_2735 family protein [Maribacter sp.]
MFGLFKKKSKIEKLDLQYKKLLAEAHKLSTSNRRQSDSKIADANEILKQIELLNKND